MQIYECEKSLGIKDEPIVAMATLAGGIEESKVIEAVKKYRDKYEKEWALQNLPKGAMLANGIMVSTSWNGNDDVFTPAETWLARFSPYLKPVNFMHKFQEKTAKIIGVITHSIAVNDSVETVYPEKDKVPENFHILVSTMLWENYFPETCGKIKKAIADKKGYLSMECTSDDFGYALRKEGSDQVNLLPRNEITAYLTKHLRAYKGTGEVEINGEKYRIGRWLRGINFTGVAYVDVPANPDSIVFEDYLSHVTASLKFENVDNNFVPKKKNSENSVSYLETKGTCVAWVV
jgi:hypothetical protein